jgi:hypothetical protein
VARSIGAVFAGMVAALVVVLGVETIGLQVFPQPPGMDALNPESVRQHLSEIHVGSFVTVIIAWALAAFAGPFVARRIAGAATWPPLVVIALFALMCAYNLIAVPSPRWMIPAAVVFVGAGALMGLRLEKQKSS